MLLRRILAAADSGFRSESLLLRRARPGPAFVRSPPAVAHGEEAFGSLCPRLSCDAPARALLGSPVFELIVLFVLPEARLEAGNFLGLDLLEPPRCDPVLNLGPGNHHGEQEAEGSTS